MALCVGKTGCVLALGPNKFVYSILEKNANLNIKKTNIIPRMIAAMEHDGTVEFEYSGSGFCNGGGLRKHISKWKHGHAFKLEVMGVNLSKMITKNYLMNWKHYNIFCAHKKQTNSHTP